MTDCPTVALLAVLNRELLCVCDSGVFVCVGWERGGGGEVLVFILCPCFGPEFGCSTCYMST